MVSSKDYHQFKLFFRKYTSKFYNNTLENDQNIDLKINHTTRVVTEAENIITSLKLNNNIGLLGKIAALFHDIGRFEQYKQYGTFLDKNSIDHGEFGLTILQKEKVLQSLPADEQEIIFFAIKNHNKREISPTDCSKKLKITQILRDADKIDIFKVVTDHYKNPSEVYSNTIDLGLPNDPMLSLGVRNAIQSKSTVKHSDINTISDFKLMQLSWIYDLHFQYSFKTIKEHNYLQIIQESLHPSLLNHPILAQLEQDFKTRLNTSF
jgi:putative nucleotidyltransferase with HDIG domain